MNYSYKDDLELHFDTYRTMLDGIAAMERAHTKFPDLVPLTNIRQMQRDALTYKKKWNL